MLGVILFVLLLLIYGIILSDEIFKKMFEDTKNEGVKNFINILEKYKENNLMRLIFSLVALISGLWNFFAPDFGANYSPTIIGALLPSVVMFCNGIIIYPEILGLFNFDDETKNKIKIFMEKYSPVAGITSIILGFLHIAFFKTILF